jgi:hypothetical protein
MASPRPVESPTVRAHKRQLTWQILVPFLVVTALIIVVAFFIATGGSATNRAVADVSTIWLIAPMLIFALLFVAMLGLLIYAITRLMRVTPRYTGKVQDFFALLSARTRIIADGVAKPIVWFQQVGAILKLILKQ